VVKRIKQQADKIGWDGAFAKSAAVGRAAVGGRTGLAV